MRALTVNEAAFVSGGENNRPWNPYTDFKAVEPSKKYREYEAMINYSLREQGLDYYGNPDSDGFFPSSGGSLGDIVAGAIIKSDTNLTGVTGIRILGVTNTVSVTYSIEVVTPTSGGVSSGPVTVGWSTFVNWLKGKK